MANPAIRFGWSDNSRDAPTTWSDGEWVDLTAQQLAALHPSSDPIRLHTSTRERVYVTGIRAWIGDEPQDSSTAVVTVQPATDGLTADSTGRDRYHWLWCQVIGVDETPVHPIGAVRIYGTP